MKKLSINQKINLAKSSNDFNILIKLTNDENEKVRNFALETLIKLGCKDDKKESKNLIDLLNNYY